MCNWSRVCRVSMLGTVTMVLGRCLIVGHLDPQGPRSACRPTTAYISQRSVGLSSTGEIFASKPQRCNAGAIG